ncbi:MAG: ribose 5-phosphate isomerase, partial [Alphaproteobacteria bacterium]|nr:ribose 5-phosphate isomerase [Alphaproteobacteria bacterium]
MDPEAQKREAAARAVQFVEPRMKLGLGTGSTVKHFLQLLAERMREGCQVVGVPTSEATREQAERLGIPITTLDETPQLDLTIDGADEIGPDLALIKGGGGALLREKIVAAASTRMIVIADESKWVAKLGRFPLPIEVVPFGLAATRAKIEKAAGASGVVKLRQGKDGKTFVTDSGNWILDA